MLDLKVCTRCHEEKSRDEFSRRAASRDGLHHWCRACTKSYQDAYREANEVVDDDPTPRAPFLEVKAPWHSDARCLDVDPEIFFPGRGRTGDPARALCSECPVRQQCLSYALETNQDFGIWGGTSPRERRPLKRRLVSKSA